MLNNFYPASYQPAYNVSQNGPYSVPTAQPYSNPQQHTESIVWVQGLEGAKAYPVAAGNNVLLMDSEASVFYIKSTDQSGVPQPLRIFDYSERTSAAPKKEPDVEYVTKAEFDKVISELKNRKGKSHE